jgi:hypothetical protein
VNARLATIEAPAPGRGAVRDLERRLHPAPGLAWRTPSADRGSPASARPAAGGAADLHPSPRSAALHVQWPRQLRRADYWRAAIMGDGDPGRSRSL